MKTEISENQVNLLFGGNSVITFESKKTGKWYTYRIKQSRRNKDIYFVSVLRGSDNNNSYTYMGTIFNKKNFLTTNASTFKFDSPAVVAFNWCFENLLKNKLRFDNNVKMFHSGHCCRCGRLLTTPQSITAGFGPECITLMNKYANKTLNLFTANN